MTTKLNFIKEISNSTMKWNLKVRIVRMWSVPDRFNPENTFSIDMILQDEKGDRIHATVGKSVIRMFKSKITELGLYKINNFLVELKNMNLKMTDHKFKLTFTQRTTVEESNDPQFDLNIFRFRPFEHLINGVDIDCDELFDVIGEVISYEDAKTIKKGEKTSVYMNVEMRDHTKNKICATFWGDFVEQILPYLNGSCDNPVIVVMQFIRAHEFKGKYSVRNTWHTSKLWINSDLPQVADFKSRLLTVRGSDSIVLSQISSGESSVVSDQLTSGNLEVKNIMDLIECQHEETLWIMATIVYLDLELGWSYVACKKCTKKVDQLGNKFKCKKCDRMDPSVTHRYRIKIQVMDNEDAYIALLLWDNEAKKLIGRSAQELKEGLIQTSAGQLDYPVEIDALLERKLLFKVLVKSSSVSKKDEVYTVLKVCDDEDILQKYDRPSCEKPFTDPDFNDEGVVESDKELTDSTVDNEMTSSSKTPAKRSRCDNRSSTVEDLDDLNAQLSSNRVKRVVKKEKK